MTVRTPSFCHIALIDNAGDDAGEIVSAKLRNYKPGDRLEELWPRLREYVVTRVHRERMGHKRSGVENQLDVEMVVARECQSGVGVSPP